MTEIKIGDIFAVKLKRRDVYFTAQILKHSEATGFVALVLDKFTSKPPTLSEALNFKPFYLDHHFWNRREFYLSADEILDADPLFIGNGALIYEPKDGASPQSAEQIYMQLAWNELPSDFRSGFKAAKKQKIEILAHENREFYENLARENPFCYEIKSAVWDENLKEFLEKTPSITNLELDGADEVIDISKTALQELVVQVRDMQKIVLNRALWRLALSGEISKLKSIECPFGG